MLAGLAAAALLPLYGWRAMFVVGGILPLFIAGLLQWSLTESPAYLAYRGEQNGTKRGGGGVVALFRNGMAAQTLAIWLIFMAVLMCVYLLTGWIPLLLTQGGFSVESAALVAAAYQGGGVLGGVAASLLLQRRGWDIVAFFALFACLSLLFLVWNPGSTVALVSGVIATGFFVTGMQNAINGAGGVSYPPPLRASGLGWALGVGRIGSIGGPLLGSLAIVLGMSEARQLFALALPPLGIAALAALWLSRNAKI
jgi:AAHS family 4-hydroxybenzoate transporter-like MFS transporter